jgi:hypothetical protein
MELSENLYLRTLWPTTWMSGGRIEVNAVFDDDVVPLGFGREGPGSVAA